jgi:hypothetical protein
LGDGCVYLMKQMSRSYKIALILKSRSSLAVYNDLGRLSDTELDRHVQAMVSRMRRNESAVIARMVLRAPAFSLN